jgi:hypothetical protein
MRNVLDKRCWENWNTHFTFRNIFLKIAQFTRSRPKLWWNRRGHKWRYNMAHTRCMLDKQGYNDSRTHLNVTLYVYCLSCLFAGFWSLFGAFTTKSCKMFILTSLCRHVSPSDYSTWRVSEPYRNAISHMNFCKTRVAPLHRSMTAL